MDRFKKINNNLYRGSAPTEKDIVSLKKRGVKRIISLDHGTGKKVKKLCEKYNIQHYMLPINFDNKFSFLKLMKLDINELLNKNTCTFFHCRAGKDRTGFLCALYRVLVNKWSYEKALKEARSLNFGMFVNADTTQFLKLILKILSYKNSKKVDYSEADDLSNNITETAHLIKNTIVSNAHDSLEPGDVSQMNSFSPYEFNAQKTYPNPNLYKNDANNPIDRETYYLNEIEGKLHKKKKNKKIKLPPVGVYGPNQTIGVGPTECFGGGLGGSSG